MSRNRLPSRSAWRRAGTVAVVLVVVTQALQSGLPATSAPSDSSPVTPPIAADAPLTAKVTGLLKALTVDEKVSLVHGARPIPNEGNFGQAGYTAGW